MKKFIVCVYSLVAISVVVMLMLLALQASRRKLVGGELYRPDFKSGFDLYIEESYDLLFQERMFTETPHSIWLVSDENLKSTVLGLCLEIKQYRELEVIQDIMAGTPLMMRYFPRIYLDIGSFCYSIEALHWDTYSGDGWTYSPIRIELFNEPVLYIKRIDLLEKPEQDDSFIFAKRHSRGDSVNNYGGNGWYSTISQESLDKLLSLISNVNAENAEIVASFK